MRIDSTAIWKEINALVPSSEGIRAKMARVIASCAKSFPHPDWRDLEQIDYATSVAELAGWFQRVVAADPPQIEVRGVWVGLCNPVVSGSATADMYFSGAERFDREDPDWASEASYYPAEAYSSSTALDAIYAIAYRQPNRLENDAEWSLCLAFAVFAVREFLAGETPLLLKSSGPVGVSVGFDSGDYIDLGELTPGGLRLFAGA